MELTVLAIVVGVAVAIFVWGRKSRDSEVLRLGDTNRSLYNNLDAVRRDLEAAKKQHATMEAQMREAKLINERLYAFGREQIKGIRADGALLPSLVRWADSMRDHFDSLRELHALQHYASAPAAKERVKESAARARAAERARDELQNRLDLYEAQAPWLTEYADCTVEEILAGLKLEQDLAATGERDEDPATVFLSAGEWSSLEPTARSQLALDRFLDRTRARSAWAAGIEYERYIGYGYESDGWMVDYHGATQGKADLGIDLICTKGSSVHVVQCKRLSPEKGIPVRENTVGQIFGSTQFLAFERKLPAQAVTPVVVTTFQLSSQARRFASALGVLVRENVPLQAYPRIKCNISRRDGARIYHLPFDQQYDRTVVTTSEGERYVSTVAEAELAGFRRAFRWRGGS